MMKRFIEVALIVEVWVIIAFMLKLVELVQQNVFVQRTIVTKTTYVTALQQDYNAKFVMEVVENVAVLQTMENL